MHLSAQKIIDYCAAILSNSEFNVEDVTETDTGEALPPEESGVIVVECKRAVNQNNNRVCVPKTWIKCKIPEEKVAFVYPAGDEDSIAMRIQNKEPLDNSWKHYIGAIKFEAETYEDAVGYLETICGGNGKQNEDTSNQKTNEDAVGCLQTICGENSKHIEEKNHAIEPVTEPKSSLKLRIVIPKLDFKSEKKKKSQRKHHKKHLREHSKDKVHKSKHRYMEQLSLTHNSPEISSPNSVDTQGGTESSISWQSNCQSSESSPKSSESEISNSVHSVPETHLKNNNNNNSYSSNRILLESLVAEKENNDGMLSEDLQLVENMYIEIMRYVQHVKVTALEKKESQLVDTEKKRTIDKLVAKYRIPLRVTDSVAREKERNGDPFGEENLQDDEIETHGDDGKKNEQNKNPFDEETLEVDEMETQDDDVMKNEAQVTEENDNTSEENLLVERENAEILLESDSDIQILTDDEDFLPSSLEVAKYKKQNISMDNDIRTLKHPHPGKGLIKIGRNSRFYISAQGLEKAKKTCHNVKKFARQLYREAFTHEALGTCSMTGFTRPALHYEARCILKNYALKYGQDVGWDSVEPKELEENLKRFLCNNRRLTKESKIVHGNHRGPSAPSQSDCACHIPRTPCLAQNLMYSDTNNMFNMRNLEGICDGNRVGKYLK